MARSLVLAALLALFIATIHAAPQVRLGNGRFNLGNRNVANRVAHQVEEEVEEVLEDLTRTGRLNALRNRYNTRQGQQAARERIAHQVEEEVEEALEDLGRLNGLRNRFNNRLGQQAARNRLAQQIEEVEEAIEDYEIPARRGGLRSRLNNRPVQQVPVDYDYEEELLEEALEDYQMPSRLGGLRGRFNNRQGLFNRRQNNGREIDFQLGGLNVQADLTRPNIRGQVRDDVNARVRAGNTLRGRLAAVKGGLLLDAVDNTANVMHGVNDLTRGRIANGVVRAENAAIRSRDIGERQLNTARNVGQLARNAVNSATGMVEGSINLHNGMRNSLSDSFARGAERSAQRRMNGLNLSDRMIDRVDGAIHSAVNLGVGATRRGGVLSNPLTTAGAVGRAMRPSASAGVNINGPLGNVRLGLGQ